MPSVLDSQSLGAGFNARTKVYLSILFLPHLCQQSNYYQHIQLLQGVVITAFACDRGHNMVTESQAPFLPSHRSRPREQRWVTVTNQYMGVANVGIGGHATVR